IQSSFSGVPFVGGGLTIDQQYDHGPRVSHVGPIEGSPQVERPVPLQRRELPSSSVSRSPSSPHRTQSRDSCPCHAFSKPLPSGSDFHYRSCALDCEVRPSRP